MRNRKLFDVFVLAPIPLIVAANLTDDNAGAGLGDAISDGLSNGGTGSGPGGQWAVWPSCHKNSAVRKNIRVLISQRMTLAH